ncbi:MAG TPA: DUF6062 family protein [Roseiflexaceae bacterium]|nr:DUF6062 family protein [Roseiflexaceae bacterium]HMP42813.1 DUF6062 family protein [Roseiflexaceae bacterium]
MREIPCFSEDTVSNDARHTVDHDLHDALAGVGCAICSLLQRSVRRTVDALTYEGVTDLDVRAELRAARGLCPAHGQALRAARQALGAALAYRSVLGELLRDLAGPPPPTTVRTRLRRTLRRYNRPIRVGPLAPRRRCPVCDHVAEMELLYLSAFLRDITSDAMRSRFAASAGLCLPHLRLGLHNAPSDAAYQTLRDCQLLIWQQLAADLDEFIRKRDYRFAREPAGEERDAWARAIDLISGLPGLNDEATRTGGAA